MRLSPCTTASPGSVTNWDGFLTACMVSGRVHVSTHWMPPRALRTPKSATRRRSASSTASLFSLVQSRLTSGVRAALQFSGRRPMLAQRSRMYVSCVMLQ